MIFIKLVLVGWNLKVFIIVIMIGLLLFNLGEVLMERSMEKVELIGRNLVESF